MVWNEKGNPAMELNKEEEEEEDGQQQVVTREKWNSRSLYYICLEESTWHFWVGIYWGNNYGVWICEMWTGINGLKLWGGQGLERGGGGGKAIAAFGLYWGWTFYYCKIPTS